MRIRSKALYQYLLRVGVLSGPEEGIALAKAEYRRQYKLHWKKQNRPRKEIRFEVTLKQFAAIRAKALEQDMRHTTYVKAIILASIGQPSALDDRLLHVLQLVSMAAIATSRETNSARVNHLLQQAEAALLEYLKRAQG